MNVTDPDLVVQQGALEWQQRLISLFIRLIEFVDESCV